MGVGAGLYMYDVVVNNFTFAISSPDEFLSSYGDHIFQQISTKSHIQIKFSNANFVFNDE